MDEEQLPKPSTHESMDICCESHKYKRLQSAIISQGTIEKGGLKSMVIR